MDDVLPKTRITLVKTKLNDTTVSKREQVDRGAEDYKMAIAIRRAELLAELSLIRMQIRDAEGRVKEALEEVELLIDTKRKMMGVVEMMEASIGEEQFI